jgi:hypothetical protein
MGWLVLGEGGFFLGTGCGWWDRGDLTYFWRSTVVALCAINVSIVIALTSNIPRANIPRDLSPDSQDESSETEEVRELHILQFSNCKY